MGILQGSGEILEEVIIKCCCGLEKHTGDRHLKGRFLLKGHRFYTAHLNPGNEPTD